jgi:hypothetical protein
MNFVRNVVSSISRVNFYLKNSFSTKPIEDKIINYKPSPIIIFKEKEIIDYNDFNQNIINIDKIDNEYFTLKINEYVFNK